jgi:pyridoxine kinase
LAKPAVIVVNSLVVRGSVGGRASLFALERAGFPVWFLPTVTLTWHPGHGPATRAVPDAGAFAGFVDDVAGSPRLGEVGAVLSGYLATAHQADAVARLVTATRARNPEVRYLCDPNIGDGGGLFVPEPVAAAIRDRLIPRADMATPNRHELGWLTGRTAVDNDGLASAAAALGVGEAVVTSAFAPEGEIGNLAVADEETLLATHRRLDAVPNGTGDLFAALYLAGRLDGRSVREAVEQAGAAVLAVAKAAADMEADEMPLAGAWTLFED